MTGKKILPWLCPIHLLFGCGGEKQVECNVDCSLPRVELASCEVDSCVIEECSQEYRDCDGDWANGCEVAVVQSPYAPDASLNNCGECGNTCGTDDLPETVEAICYYGECRTQCKEGYRDADDNLSNGCEGLSLTLLPPEQAGCYRPVETIECPNPGVSCSFSYFGDDCRKIYTCSAEGYTSAVWQVTYDDCPEL